MDANSLLTAIILISTISYLFDQVLDYLNLKHQRREIPPEVAAFYDPSKYIRSLDYHRDLTRFGFVTSAFGFLGSLAMLLFGGFGWVDSILMEFIDSEIMLAVVFFGVLMIATDILTLPFQLYSTFVIEAKYGFNKTTVKTFFTDKLKGYLLAALIGAPLLALLIFFILRIGPSFWIWFSIVASIFILFMNMFYTSLILPLFNKLSPLPDGELKSAIEQFAGKVQFPLDNIFVIDGSKRSSKANAFFSGIGRKKKIVLYDTLIDKHSKEELVAVLAHEVGHFKKKHIIFSFILSIVQIFFMMFVLSLIVYNPELSKALGGEANSIHLNLIAFAILFTPISGLTGLFMTMYSRRNEYEADAYASKWYDGNALATALKRLSVDSLSNLYPHPVYVFFHYSHPPLLKRLSALQNRA